MSLGLFYRQTDMAKDKYWIPSTLPTSDLKRTNEIFPDLNAFKEGLL